MDGQSFDLGSEGSVAVTGWSVWDGEGERRGEIVLINTATGERRTLLGVPGLDFNAPWISPHGWLVACTRETQDSAR